MKTTTEMIKVMIAENSPYAFYLFQWVPYQTDAKRWRLKMCHDVRTFDGREALGIDPILDGNLLEMVRAVEQAHGIGPNA